VMIAVPRARRSALAGVMTAAIAATTAWIWTPLPQRTGTMRVAVVQPGVIHGGPEAPQRRFDRQEQLTRQLAGRGVHLVVWGESSIGVDLAIRPDLRQRLAALSREVHADLLVNVDARAAGRPGIFKSSILVGPNGPIGPRYEKIRLVPFGEYIPFRSVLGWATSVGKAATEDRMRGTHQVIMKVPDAGELRIGPLICFETAFPDMSRQLARHGAQMLVAQSSTSTFQDSWAPEQHASLAALRSAEAWRPMVHSTLTGVSAVFGPRGEAVGGRLPTSASTAAVYDVPLSGGTSPYVRMGDWVVYGSLATLAVFGAYEGVRLGPRRRGRPLSRTAPAPGSRHVRIARGSATRPRH
jgi:apolipoprotein N-acyltransferase